MHAHEDARPDRPSSNAPEQGSKRLPHEQSSSLPHFDSILKRNRLSTHKCHAVQGLGSRPKAPTNLTENATRTDTHPHCPPLPNPTPRRPRFFNRGEETHSHGTRCHGCGLLPTTGAAPPPPPPPPVVPPVGGRYLSVHSDDMPTPTPPPWAGGVGAGMPGGLAATSAERYLPLKELIKPFCSWQEETSIFRGVIMPFLGARE